MITKFFSINDSMQRLEGFYTGKKTKYLQQKIKIISNLVKKRKISFAKIFNIFVSWYSYLFKLNTSGKTPVVIDIELDNRCNERCVFCRNEKGEIFDINPESKPGQFIDKGRLDYGIFEEMAKEVKKTTLLIIPYVNGEPFIYKHLDKVLRLLKDLKMGSMLSSNGLLLNKKNIDLILSEDLDQIKIHVSGFTNKIHQIQHRLGDVELIKKNLKDLSVEMKKRKSNLIVLVDYILYEHNKHEIDMFKKFNDDELGFDFNIRPGNPKGMEDSEKPQPEVSAINIPCEWLWKVMTINWNADLLPCCDYVTWNKVGGYANFVGKENKKNASTLEPSKSIIETWNGKKIIEMRKTHREKGRAPIPICSTCNKVGVEYKY